MWCLQSLLGVCCSLPPDPSSATFLLNPGSCSSGEMALPTHVEYVGEDLLLQVHSVKVINTSGDYYPASGANAPHANHPRPPADGAGRGLPARPQKAEVEARENLAALFPLLHSVRSLIREERAGRGDLGGMVSAGAA